MRTFPQSPAKRPFSLYIMLLPCALFILVFGLVIQFPRHHRLSSCLRQLLFLPYSWCLIWIILNTTTGDPQADLGAGGALATLLLVGFDFLIATDAQRELYPVDDAGKRIGQPIIEAPLQIRIKWAIQLIGNLRGVGWNFEPRFLLEKRSKIGNKQTTRGSFVIRQLVRLIFLAFLDQVGTHLGFINPVFSSTFLSPKITHSGIVRVLWRCVGLAIFAVTSYARIGALHCAISLVAVGVFNSRIQNWPPLFGSIEDAWTVQRFWGRVWHQSIRRSLTSCTDFVVSWYPYQSHKHLASFLRLSTAFLITGVIHGAGEYMMLTSLPMNTVDNKSRVYLGRGACIFFTLQAGAIIAEKIAARLFWPRNRRKLDVHRKGTEPKARKDAAESEKDVSSSCEHSVHRCQMAEEPIFAMRVLGYLWVVGWLSWSVQYFVGPMVLAGVFDPPR